VSDDAHEDRVKHVCVRQRSKPVSRSIVRN
jgi:hypothetical protein